MLWLALSLSTALFAAAGDVVLKRHLRPLGTVQMALARALCPALILLPALGLVPWPALDRTFWLTLLALLPLETTALVLYTEAIRTSPLSLSVPFLAFTPGFMIFTGALILGERLPKGGVCGVLLIVAGSYLLHLPEARRGWLAPVRAVFRERGSRLMLLVALIYAFTSVLGKLAVEHSAPLFFACFYFVVHGLFATLVLSLLFRARSAAPLRRAPGGSPLVCLTQSAMVVSHMWAISLAPAAYMIAVKRLSILFGVLGGWLLFQEEHPGSRLAGASLMLLGVFVIAASG